MPVPFLYIYNILLQDAWSTTQQSSPSNEGWRPITSGERKSLEDMIRKRKLRGRDKIEAQTYLVGEDGKKVESS
jgi:hypothetical protein